MPHYHILIESKFNDKIKKICLVLRLIWKKIQESNLKNYQIQGLNIILSFLTYLTQVSYTIRDYTNVYN